jgi:putative nucleotidyltransferase with HDIG domain
MMGWLKRWSLVREGFSSGKFRRQVASEEGSLSSWLEESGLVRIILLILSTLAVARIGLWSNPDPVAHVLVFTALFMLVFTVVIPFRVPEAWKSNHLLLLLVGSLIVNFFTNKTLYLYSDLIHIYDIAPARLIVPAALAPMLASILIAPHAGLIVGLFLALLGNLFIDPSPSFLLANLLPAFAASFFTRRIRRRSDLLMAGVGVGVVGLLCALMLGSLQRAEPVFLIVQSVWAVALGVLTALVVSAILPILEWLFDRITDISWVELTDLNHPILRRMMIEAPGTYQHSLMVANLSEAAAESIGANSTQCRVSAYFHDIGKLTKPNYFIENSAHEKNPHDDLAPSMSALIVIAHVKDGVDLALKYRLRKPIIDVIQQHHGDSLVFYFYKKAQQQAADARAGGKILGMREDDVPDVEEPSFRYPGPRPQFKESAIVSLADSIESASRSLKNPTAQKVENLVREIVRDRVEDGQLNESQLTFNELAAITDRFCFTLKNMLHARIEYPKSKGEEEREKDREKAAARASGDSQSAAPVPAQGKGPDATRT